MVMQLFGGLGPWSGLRMKSSLGPVEHFALLATHQHRTLG